MPTTLGKRKFTPLEVAVMWGVSKEKIIAWIRSGELRAIDASTQRAHRPRFLVDLTDLQDFEARRAVIPAPKTSPQPKSTGPHH